MLSPFGMRRTFVLPESLGTSAYFGVNVLRYSFFTWPFCNGHITTAASNKEAGALLVHQTRVAEPFASYLTKSLGCRSVSDLA
eukprot:2733750-Karenia_brevis.AAC.1